MNDAWQTPLCPPTQLITRKGVLSLLILFLLSFFFPRCERLGNTWVLDEKLYLFSYYNQVRGKCLCWYMCANNKYICMNKGSTKIGFAGYFRGWRKPQLSFFFSKRVVTGNDKKNFDKHRFLFPRDLCDKVNTNSIDPHWLLYLNIAQYVCILARNIRKSFTQFLNPSKFIETLSQEFTRHSFVFFPKQGQSKPKEKKKSDRDSVWKSIIHSWQYDRCPNGLEHKILSCFASSLQIPRGRTDVKLRRIMRDKKKLLLLLFSLSHDRNFSLEYL